MPGWPRSTLWLPNFLLFTSFLFPRASYVIYLASTAATMQDIIFGYAYESKRI